MTHAATRVWHGTMPVEFLYTLGAAGLRFFQTLKQKGTLAVTVCAECRVTYLPPRLYCENCFADLGTAWRDVAGRGRVHTFTLVHVDREGRRLDRPEIVAFVRIDGTNGGLVTRLLNVAPSEVRVDLPVEIILQAPRRRRGGPADIVGFTPVRSAPKSTARRRAGRANRA
jgi:hypothetical protein